MDDFYKTLISGLLSGSVMAAVLSLLMKRWQERVAAEVKLGFEREILTIRSGREWREKVLAELLGPMIMQLDRTRRAFDRWKSKNVYLETKVIREGNLTIRDLVLTKGHLIPPDLLVDAGRLAEHYDRWLEEFEQVRGGTEPALDQPFVFVGPKGFPFPSDAERRFTERFNTLWNELYGVQRATSP